MAELASSGIAVPYEAGGTATGLLEYDCQTDAAGRAWFYLAFGTTTRPHAKVPVFWRGDFPTQNIIGLDMDAVIQLGGLIQGTLTNGILRMR